MGVLLQLAEFFRVWHGGIRYVYWILCVGVSVEEIENGKARGEGQPSSQYTNISGIPVDTEVSYHLLIVLVEDAPHFPNVSQSGNGVDV